MLEELQSKIEAAHGRLAGLSDDIERMRSIEDALIETDRSIATSANDLKSFVDAASSTHQSLIDAADAFKDAANALGMIDVVKLSEAINAGNDQIRGEILRTETKSRDDLEVMEKRITDAVAYTSNEVRTEIGRNQENVQKDLTAVEQRLMDSITASTEAIRNQEWVGVLTLLVSIAVLVIAVLILLNN